MSHDQKPARVRMVAGSQPDATGLGTDASSARRRGDHTPLAAGQTEGAPTDGAGSGASSTAQAPRRSLTTAIYGVLFFGSAAAGAVLVTLALVA